MLIVRFSGEINVCIQFLQSTENKLESKEY